jgi:TldD protein
MIDKIKQQFGIDDAMLGRLISTAGGDYADLYFENTLSNCLSLRDGVVNKASCDVDFGAGARVLSGDKTGYAYTGHIDEKNLADAMKTAGRIASGAIHAPKPVEIRNLNFKSRYPVQQNWETVTVSNKAFYVQLLNDRIFALNPHVCKVSVSLSDYSSQILFCNSEGTLCADERPMVSLSAVCIMEKNGRIENGYSARSYRKGAEFLTADIVEEIAREAVQRTERMFEAITPEGGELPVVMAAGSSGILLHEAIGHAFEADFNRKGTSIFSDKLGKQICNRNINIVDDGTIEGNRGSISFDDEGVASRKNYLVHDGVLTSYLHDRISAACYKTRPTGNGRRESYKCAPLPRMCVTYMENGDATEADIIASVKKGIYVDNFSNGQVQIGAGDFTFFVKSGCLIENGHLTQPVKDINIIGNGPQALADITMVGNNLKIDNSTWTCGKDGQSVPVSQGLPSALVGKLTIGGINSI